MSLPEPGECSIEVISMTGEMFISVDTGKKDREQRLDVTALAPGAYAIRLMWHDSIFFKKLVIAR